MTKDLLVFPHQLFENHPGPEHRPVVDDVPVGGKKWTPARARRI